MASGRCWTSLPDVLHSLESCDPALVRSAIPNYFLAELAADDVKVMLTGEGADELYAGYDYLRGFAQPEQLQEEMKYIVGALHNTNLQRADRMSMRFGFRARAVSGCQLDCLRLGAAAAWKMTKVGAHGERVEKALLRNAFAGRLPEAIVRRPKQVLGGAGSSRSCWPVTPKRPSATGISGRERWLCAEWGYTLPNKEGLYYYRLLAGVYRTSGSLPPWG